MRRSSETPAEACDHGAVGGDAGGREEDPILDGRDAKVQQLQGVRRSWIPPPEALGSHKASQESVGNRRVHPVVLGAGKRLFGESSDKKAMRLVAMRTLDDGVAFLTYERTRDA